MLKRSLLALLVVLALLLPPTYATAQQSTPTPTITPPGAAAAGTPMPAGTPTPATNPELNISWPQPISEIYGLVDIVGTANIKNMAFYRLEAIQLAPDQTVPEDAAWIPLTTDILTPVVDNVLAQIDTTKVSDGLYELRLSAFTGTVNAPGAETDVTVGPVRVNNENDSGTGVLPTPGPTATPVAKSAGPVAVTLYPGTGGVNIRRCTVASDYACPVLGYLSDGVAAPVLGIANDGSGWYLITTPSGLSGWVSPTVVSIIGNTAGLPGVTPSAPSAPPPPPTPAPTATSQIVPPPPVYGQVIPTGIGIQNNVKPQCAQAFNVEVNVYNSGNGVSGPGSVTLQDIHVDNGAVTFTNYGAYPSLNPGQNYVVVIPANITTYVGSNHELRAYNGYQQVQMRYTLGTGSCGAPPPPTPTPTRGPTPTPKPPKQCIVTSKSDSKYYDKPMGNRLGYLPSGQGYAPTSYEKVNGIRWYQINYNGQVWVKERDMGNVPSACKNL